MRLELTRVGLLVELANHYTTRGACRGVSVCVYDDASQKIWMKEIHFFFIVKHNFWR